MDWSAIIILFSVSQRLLCRVVSKVRESLSLISKVGMVSCNQGILIRDMVTMVDIGVMIHFFVHYMMTQIEREIVVNNVGINNMVVINHMGHLMSKNVILFLLMMGFRSSMFLRLMVGSCLAMMTFRSLGVSMTSLFVSFGMLFLLIMFVSLSRLVVLLVLSWLLVFVLVLFGGLCRVWVVITLAINSLEGVS